jgi:hypothetical protein
VGKVVEEPAGVEGGAGLAWMLSLRVTTERDGLLDVEGTASGDTLVLDRDWFAPSTLGNVTCLRKGFLDQEDGLQLRFEGISWLPS